MTLNPSAAPSLNHSTIRLAICSGVPAGEVGEQLPQSRLLAPHQADDHLGAAARGLDRAGVGEVLDRQRLVERQVREIVPAEAAGQALAADLRIGERVELARHALRL